MINRSNPTANAVTHKEWGFVVWVIVAVLIVTTLPYAYGYLSAPPDKQFMGIMLDIPDHGQYLSWWRSFQSSFLVPNKLTPEPNRAIFFNLLWWILAQVSRLTGLGYAPVYQAFRWIAGGLAIWAFYRFTALFIPEVKHRRTALLLFVFSSGLGWIWVVSKYTLTPGVALNPLDIYIAEGNTFLCILAYPHFAIALAFILLIFELIFRGWREHRLRHMVTAGILAFVLGWMHAYDLWIIYGVLGAFALGMWIKHRAFPWNLFWGGLIIFLISWWGALYSFLLTSADPLWKEVLKQFANAGVYTPNPPHLVIFFGFPLILAVITWVGLGWRRQWSDETLFILVWFLMGGLLIYIPTDYQVHMLNSLQAPMLILSLIGLVEFVIPAMARWLHRPAPSITSWVFSLFILLIVPANIYLWTWRFIDLARHSYPFYLYKQEVSAMDWLRENSPPEAVVMSSLTIGQYLPAVSGNTAFLAHWAQTVDFYTKSDLVHQFYTGSLDDPQRKKVLDEYRVQYVFDGPAERASGNVDLRQLSFLKVVYQSPEVTLFKVQNP